MNRIPTHHRSHPVVSQRICATDPLAIVFLTCNPEKPRIIEKVTRAHSITKFPFRTRILLRCLSQHCVGAQRHRSNPTMPSCRSSLTIPVDTSLWGSHVFFSPRRNYSKFCQKKTLSSSLRPFSVFYVAATSSFLQLPTLPTPTPGSLSPRILAARPQRCEFMISHA